MWMSVRLVLITATCTLPALMYLAALNVAVVMDGWETASSVWVSTNLQYLSCDFVLRPDNFILL